MRVSIPESEIVLRAFPREGYLLRLRHTDRGYELGLWRLDSVAGGWFPVRNTIMTFRNKREAGRVGSCLKAVAMPEGGKS